MNDRCRPWRAKRWPLVGSDWAARFTRCALARQWGKQSRHPAIACSRLREWCVARVPSKNLVQIAYAPESPRHGFGPAFRRWTAIKETSLDACLASVW